MKNYKCHCPICNSDFDYEMEPDEFKTLVMLAKNSVYPDGRLMLACDSCHPMRYSNKKKETSDRLLS